MNLVRTKIRNETNSGNRCGWSKHVTSVDATKTNGYAFIGDFLPDNTEIELPVGAVIVQKHPEGSVKHSWESGHVYRLGSDGDLYETNGKSYNWRRDFVSFRDAVVRALAREPFDPAAPKEPAVEQFDPCL